MEDPGIAEETEDTLTSSRMFVVVYNGTKKTGFLIKNSIATQLCQGEVNTIRNGLI